MLNQVSRYLFIFEDPQIYLLLTLIEKYVNGAELQIRRIDQTRNLFRKTFQPPFDTGTINWNIYSNRMLKLFCDIHFYFICVAITGKCLKRLSEELNNNNLYKINSEFQKTFKKEIRDDLEHIDERAVGKNRGKDIAIGYMHDFGNLINDNFSFNGKTYPVNKESLNVLKTIYKKIISIIHKEYALKNPLFVSNMKRDGLVKKMTKMVQQDYQNYLNSQ